MLEHVSGRALAGRRLRPRVADATAGGPACLQRYGQAWRQAVYTARRFVYEFGAARVAVIGDLVHPDGFRRDSGIEFVVWGLRADVFRRTVRRARDACVAVRIHDGDCLDARVAALVRSEAIELACRGREA